MLPQYPPVLPMEDVDVASADVGSIPQLYILVAPLAVPHMAPMFPLPLMLMFLSIMLLMVASVAVVKSGCEISLIMGYVPSFLACAVSVPENVATPVVPPDMS